MALIKVLRRNGTIDYRRPCAGCGTPVRAQNQRCRSCETRRRHQAGLMKAPPHISVQEREGE
jgi:hypothetical protein